MPRTSPSDEGAGHVTRNDRLRVLWRGLGAAALRAGRGHTTLMRRAGLAGLAGLAGSAPRSPCTQFTKVHARHAGPASGTPFSCGAKPTKRRELFDEHSSRAAPRESATFRGSAAHANGDVARLGRASAVGHARHVWDTRATHGTRAPRCPRWRSPVVMTYTRQRLRSPRSVRCRAPGYRYTAPREIVPLRANGRCGPCRGRWRKRVSAGLPPWAEGRTGETAPARPARELGWHCHHSCRIHATMPRIMPAGMRGLLRCNSLYCNELRRSNRMLA
jgi:hypothetical protein